MDALTTRKQWERTKDLSKGFAHHISLPVKKQTEFPPTLKVKRVRSPLVIGKLLPACAPTQLRLPNWVGFGSTQIGYLLYPTIGILSKRSALPLRQSRSGRARKNRTELVKGQKGGGATRTNEARECMSACHIINHGTKQVMVMVRSSTRCTSTHSHTHKHTRKHTHAQAHQELERRWEMGVRVMTSERL
jgi:hypothetical protein